MIATSKQTGQQSELNYFGYKYLVNSGKASKYTFSEEIFSPVYKDHHTTETPVYIIGKNQCLDQFLPLSFSSNSVVICLNGTINLVDRCDLLVMNDFEAIKEFNEKGIENISTILIPTYPHVYMKSDINHDYKEFLSLMPSYDDYILYQLHTTPNYINGILDFGMIHTVAETAIAYMLHLGYRNFFTYGIGIKSDYCKAFENPEYHNDSDYLKIVIKQIMRRINDHKAKIYFNGINQPRLSNNNNLIIR